MNDVDSIISQLEQQKAAIERAIAALRDVTLSEPAPVKRGRPGRPPGRPLKVASPKVASPQVPKKRRRLSAEGRKRIIEALKKRWAEKKAAAKKAAKKAS